MENLNANRDCRVEPICGGKAIRSSGPRASPFSGDDQLSIVSAALVGKSRFAVAPPTNRVELEQLCWLPAAAYLAPGAQPAMHYCTGYVLVSYSYSC